MSGYLGLMTAVIPEDVRVAKIKYDELMAARNAEINFIVHESGIDADTRRARTGASTANFIFALYNNGMDRNGRLIKTGADLDAAEAFICENFPNKADRGAAIGVRCPGDISGDGKPMQMYSTGVSMEAAIVANDTSLLAPPAPDMSTNAKIGLAALVAAAIWYGTR